MGKHEANIVSLNNRLLSKSERIAVRDILKKNNSTAAKIIEFQKTIKINAREIAGAFNISVVEQAMPNRRLAAFLNPINGDPGWEIVINEEMSSELKNWAIIHELCHWLIDMDCKPGRFNDNRIQPLFLGKFCDTYSNCSIEVDGRHIDMHGRTLVDVTIIYNDFVHDIESRRQSERMVNWTSGFIFLPKRTAISLTEKGLSVDEIADATGAPRGVISMQLRLLGLQSRKPAPMVKPYGNELRLPALQTFGGF
ncbi:MAG: hypothetical protein AAFN79_09850 [Pseudomonadota bacterium]